MKKMFLFAIFFTFFNSILLATPYADMLTQRAKILGIQPAPHTEPVPPTPITPVQTEFGVLTTGVQSVEQKITDLGKALDALNASQKTSS